VTLAELPAPYVVEFTHYGDYSERDDDRPTITVQLMSFDGDGNRLKEYETGVMVDTGSDKTLLSVATAERLGLARPRHPTAWLTGATSNQHIAEDGEEDDMPCFGVDLLVQLCGHWLPLPALIPFEPDARVKQVLGRRGVFDEVMLAFGGGEPVIYACH
jgi:hypothetical protein